MTNAVIAMSLQWCLVPQKGAETSGVSGPVPVEYCSASSRRSFLCGELDRNHILDVGKNLIIGNLGQVFVDFGDDLVTHVRL